MLLMLKYSSLHPAQVQQSSPSWPPTWLHIWSGLIDGRFLLAVLIVGWLLLAVVVSGVVVGGSVVLLLVSFCLAVLIDGRICNPD